MRIARVALLRNATPSKLAEFQGDANVSQKRSTYLLLTAAASIPLLAAAALFSFHDRLLGPTEHVLLSLTGSTSLGDDLLPKLAESFLCDELGAVRTGSRIVAKDAKGHLYRHVWGQVPGKSGLQVIRIYAAGSGAAFKCLAAEDGPDFCDIGMSSRPIDDLDRQQFPAVRSLGDRSSEHVIALDGIAVIVNPHNTVNKLSIPQLRAIYSGQIRNWTEVGGEDAAIELYGRDQNSGTFEMFTEKVMGKDLSLSSKGVIVPADHQIGDSNLIVEAVMHSPNAIGYVSSPLVKDAKALMISDGSGAALLPTALSVVTEDYPISRRLLLYAWDDPGSLMNAFIRYVMYKPGQAIVAKTPFVELTPRVFPAPPPQKAPFEYKKIASKYSRIGLSFHFSSANTIAGSDSNNQLDSLASVNVLRLRTFLAQHGGTGSDILLIGFADKTETRSHNAQLAQQRAESVVTSLRAIGVIVPSENIRSFGADLPVASNDSPEGRSKNRRVEVWVRKGLL
jgi:phosphate transport system substrate-binding protein